VSGGFQKADLDRGFITSGLWGYSRHPNFAAEQSIWFILYQWSCFTSKTLYNWAAVGPSFLILLFQGSTWLTELITAGKYSEYPEYQRNVGMFVPKRLAPYKTPVVMPRIIRTSDLAKKLKEKQK
jgi:steroid 5-alpha reductase family enzyme